MQDRLRSALTSLVLFYFLAIGMTFNGILSAEIRTVSVVFGIVLFALWGLTALRKGWRLIATPIDAAVLVWIAAFAASLIFNLDLWRRSAPAFFYVGFYIFLWYVIWQLWAYRGINREMLVSGLLFVGVIVLIIAVMQLRQIAANNLSAYPVSLFGNTNSLGTFLVLIMPLIFSRVASGRLPTRIIMLVYGVAIGALIVLTGSRGALIGGCAAFAAFCLVGFPARIVNERLKRLSPQLRRQILIGGGLIVLIALIAASLILAETFNQPGRSLSLRTFLYDSAITVFSENPLFGRGLFTFGGELARLNSMPYTEPHSHAHNIFLHVAAELGLVGVLALILTIALTVRAVVKYWKSGQFNDLRAGACAAIVGFGVHHLFDMTSMMPAIAITALILLAVLLLPESPLGETQIVRRSNLLSFAPGVLGLVLTVCAIWSLMNYREYVNALSQAVQTGDYVQGANRLDVLSQSDPDFALYYQQSGMLLALAAWQQTDNRELLIGARTAFERYTELVPQYAVGWLNVAALRASTDDATGADAALAQAITLAPDLQGMINDLGGNGDPSQVDWEFGMNIPYAQFLHQAIPRHFIPQIVALHDPE